LYSIKDFDFLFLYLVFPAHISSHILLEIKKAQSDGWSSLASECLYRKGMKFMCRRQLNNLSTNNQKQSKGILFLILGGHCSYSSLVVVAYFLYSQ
jgi:hypothetical protein